MGSKKLKAVLILGPGFQDYSKNCEELVKLYNKAGYLAIGDGIKPLAASDLILEGRIDNNTRIDILIHGRILGNKHYIRFDNNLHATSELFSLLNEYNSPSQLQINLWSCYGDAANADVKFLGEGSVLFNHISLQHPLLSAPVFYSIKKNIIKLQQTNMKSSIEDFIDNLSHKLLQTASISTYINGKIHELILAPKLSDVIASPDKVLEEAVVKITDFANEMHRLITAEDQTVYSIFQLKEPIAKTFSENEKKELQVGYLIHTCSIGNIEEIRKIKTINDHTYLEKIINSYINDITPLYVATRNGHIEIVEILIEHKANVNMDGMHGTPLNLASQNGYTKIVKILAEHNADVDKAGKDEMTPLYAAAHNGHREVVKILIKHKANVNKNVQNTSPLNVASQNGHIEIVKILLDHKADVDKANNEGVAPLHVAAQNGHTEIVKIVVDHKADVNKADNTGATPICRASQNGHTEIVKILLDHKADINKADNTGATPICRASQNGHTEIVKILLDHKADVDKANNERVTSLHVAAQKGHTEIVKILLDHKADVNKADNTGATPFYRASQYGHIEIAKILLDHKADVNKTDIAGVTPLHMACYLGKLDVVTMLINAKADLFAKMFQNDLTPLDLAKKMHHSEIVKILEEAIEAEQKASITANGHSHELHNEYGDHDVNYQYDDEL